MYKRFEAETLSGALDKAKKELGPDVVLLSKRQVRQSGITGILGKKVWEVVAYRPTSEDRGLPPKPQTAAAAPVSTSNPSMKKPMGTNTAAFFQEKAKSKIRNPVNHLLDEPALPFAELPSTQKLAEKNPFKAYLSSPAVQKPAETAESFRAKPAAGIESAVLRDLLKEVRALTDKVNAQQAPVSDQVFLPGILPAFYQRLLLQEVPRETARDLMNALCEHSILDMNDESKTLEKLEDLLSAEIQTAALDDLFSSRRPRTLFLVGPAGVGKTSTIAKIALLNSQNEKTKIAFVTLDTFRIAAAEQLKSYADLIQASIEVVCSQDEFASAIVRHADKDLILVDTPGKNPCSPATLSELSGYLKHLSAAKLPAPAVLPVLSATTKLADLQRYISCYQSLDPAGMIFTKIDETNTYGSLLPVLAAAKLPLIFLGCGQDIPGDLEPANSRRLARRILG